MSAGWRKAIRSLLRIILTLLAIVGVVALAYALWQPGTGDGAADRGENGVWLQHGWLADDGWLLRNRQSPSRFRSPEQIAALLDRLREHHIRDLYPHLCPSASSGDLPQVDDAQTERFLRLAAERQMRVLPWIGGASGGTARVGDPVWRSNFVAAARKLLLRHPQLAGVQVNVEPLPSGDRDFLRLLEESRPVLGGRLLAVAAYPPPTWLHPVPQVHWEPEYLHAVMERSDQVACMLYDTAVRQEKVYTALVSGWTGEVLRAAEGTPCRVLLGVPAYDDPGAGYHDPEVEHLSSALQGVKAGLQAADANAMSHYAGCAIYCEWQMTLPKWEIWRRLMVAPGLMAPHP